MILNKLSKAIGTGLMITPLIMLSGCSSDDSGDGGASSAPPVPLTGITGIWTGKFSWETPQQPLVEYDVTMMFHTPEGATEGSAIGLVLGDGPIDQDKPHFLFEGGYEYSAAPIESDPAKDNSTVACEGDVWAVGRFGQQGTFVQEFSYATGSAAGPDQRGAGCFYLRDTDDDGYVNELTGTISFEEAGKFDVALTYSDDNVRDVTVYDLGSTGSDKDAYGEFDDVKYHLWSNDNSGSSMTYNAAYIPVGDRLLTYLITKEDHPTADCGGLIVVSQVEGQNLFELRLPDESPVLGCNITLPGETWEQDGVNYTAYTVNLPYFGLGALVDTDDDGNLEFIHMMGSKESGAGSTTQVLHNRFIVQE